MGSFYNIKALENVLGVFMALRYLYNVQRYDNIKSSYDNTCICNGVLEMTATTIRVHIYQLYSLILKRMIRYHSNHIYNITSIFYYSKKIRT